MEENVNLRKINKFQFLVILVFGLVFAGSVVFTSAKTGVGLFSEGIFIAIIGLFGLIVGYIVSVILFSKAGKKFMGIDKFSKFEYLFVFLTGILFFMLYGYFIDYIYSALIAGFVMGIGIVRLFKNKK